MVILVFKLEKYASSSLNKFSMLFSNILCFGFSAICFYGLSVAALPHHLSHRLYYILSVVGMCVAIFLYEQVEGTHKSPHHFSPLPDYFALGVEMCGESISTQMRTSCMECLFALSADFVSLLVLVHVLQSFCGRVRLKNKRGLKFGTVCSCKWSRRRAHWLNRRVCRSDYIAFALRSKTLAAKSFKMEATRTIVIFGEQTSTFGIPTSPPHCATMNNKTEIQWIEFGPQFPSDCSGDGPKSPQSNLQDHGGNPDSFGNPVAIPEFDPNNNCRIMPSWMRYDPKLVGPKRYSCIVCKCEVSVSQIERHERGKRHQRQLGKVGHLCYENATTLAAEFMTSYNRRLIIVSMENKCAIERALKFLTKDDDAIVSVGFLVEDGEILCLSLVTSKSCVSIDRTIMMNADFLKNKAPFVELFQGRTVIFGEDMWEMTLLLYHRY